VVNLALTIGGLLGVFLSAGFVYLEVGRYAAPQVPQSLFDERRELIAYTAGLFIGVPTAVPLLFYLEALANAALPAALIDLILVVLALELAVWAFARSHYFGRSSATPFYTLGMRAGTGAILILTIMARYLGGLSFDATSEAAVGVQSVAVLLVSVTGGMLSLPPRVLPGGIGGPLRGGIYSAVSFALLGTAALFGPELGIVGSLIALGGALLIYLRQLRPLLARTGAPPAGSHVSPETPVSGFGRRR
jgi:hypothetical protein